jgi:hypothetical protein
MKYFALLLLATTAAFGEEVAVPEIDANTAGSVLAMVTGGMLILRSRSRK